VLSGALLVSNIPFSVMLEIDKLFEGMHQFPEVYEGVLIVPKIFCKNNRRLFFYVPLSE
jgi:hypothetical protein